MKSQMPLKQRVALRLVSLLEMHFMENLVICLSICCEILQAASLRVAEQYIDAFSKIAKEVRYWSTEKLYIVCAW